MNNKKITYFLSLIFLFLLQTASLNVFSNVPYVVPQLLLLFVIILSLTHSLPEAVWFAFTAGFLAEVFSGLFFGTYIFGFVVIGVAVYVTTRHLISQEIMILPTAILVISGTLLLPLLAYFFNWFASALYSTVAVPIRNFYPPAIIWTVFSNLIFCYPITKIFIFFFRLKTAK